MTNNDAVYTLKNAAFLSGPDGAARIEDAITMAVNALQGSDECAECAIDPEKLMRDKILESFAQCDFVHVTRCKDCRWYKPATKLSKSWCERYDEPREAAGYCSHAVPKEV